MFGNKKEGVITFYYESNDLFNDVGILSAYLAKNIMAESAVDKYSITDDEKELYEACLKQAVPNIYEAMLKMTSGVENAFDTNENDYSAYLPCHALQVGKQCKNLYR